MLAWALAYGATAVLGNGGVICMSLSDWTRYGKGGPKTTFPIMIIACPIFIFLACELLVYQINPRVYDIAVLTPTDALGIITASASATVLGETIWQPYLLLRAIQAHYNNSSSSRAAV